MCKCDLIIKSANSPATTKSTPVMKDMYLEKDYSTDTAYLLYFNETLQERKFIIKYCPLCGNKLR